jgi:hypothetical protein
VVAREPVAEKPAVQEKPPVAEKLAVVSKPVVAARAARPMVVAVPTIVRDDELAPGDPAPELEEGEPSVASEGWRVVVVPVGGSLWNILRQTYGNEFSRTDRAALYDRVRALNPQVKDVNVIMAGDRLRLPLVARGEL